MHPSIGRVQDLGDAPPQTFVGSLCSLIVHHLRVVTELVHTDRLVSLRDLPFLALAKRYGKRTHEHDRRLGVCPLVTYSTYEVIGPKIVKHVANKDEIERLF